MARRIPRKWRCAPPSLGCKRWRSRITTGSMARCGSPTPRARTACTPSWAWKPAWPGATTSPCWRATGRATPTSAGSPPRRTTTGPRDRRSSTSKPWHGTRKRLGGAVGLSAGRDSGRGAAWRGTPGHRGSGDLRRALRARQLLSRASGPSPGDGISGQRRIAGCRAAHRPAAGGHQQRPLPRPRPCATARRAGLHQAHRHARNGGASAAAQPRVRAEVCRGYGAALRRRPRGAQQHPAHCRDVRLRPEPQARLRLTRVSHAQR